MTYNGPPPGHDPEPASHWGAIILIIATLIFIAWGITICYIDPLFIE